MLRASEESPRMFESDFLDLFSRVPWHAVPAIFVPVSFGLFYLSMKSATKHKNRKVNSKAAKINK
jgi:hypothetical protein